MKQQYKPLSFLNSNLSLGINERKLLNVLIHELYNKLQEKNDKKNRKTNIGIQVRKFHIYLSLHRPGKEKFRLSKVMSDLLKKELILSNKNKNPLIHSLQLTEGNVVFELNPAYNKTISSTKVFYIDQDIQRQITKKNTLFLYELCMSKITNLKQLAENKNKIFFEISLNKFLNMLGYEDYKQMRSADLYRTVLTIGAEELNRLPSGFKVTIDTVIVRGVFESFSFKVIIDDADYLNKLKTYDKIVYV